MTTQDYTKRMAALGIDRGMLQKQFKDEISHANVARNKVKLANGKTALGSKGSTPRGIAGGY